MISRALALGLLAAGCVTAAGGGAYVAVRQNAAPPAPVAAVPAQPAADAARQQPVSETEAVVTPAPAEDAAVERSAEAPIARTAERRARTASRAEGARNSRAARREVEATVPARPAPQRAPIASPAPPPEPVAARESAPPPAIAAEPAAEPPREIESPRHEPRFEEVTVPASAVIGLQIDTPVSSERAQVEDRVTARVTRDVMAHGHVAIPAGSRMLGSVTLVERGGKVKERARLGVRFHTLVLANGTELPLRTEPIYREGESPAHDSSRKIGGAAVGGAILGAILGGGKGAVIGGATGAAGGTAAVMAGDRNVATLPTGTIVTVRLASPVDVQIEQR